MTDDVQTATVLINVENPNTTLRLTRTIAACASIVVSVHTLPGMPVNANFRTQVGWPMLGSAGVIMRPNGADFSSIVVMPPVAVLR